jgi:hypothetical protein
MTRKILSPEILFKYSSRYRGSLLTSGTATF